MERKPDFNLDVNEAIDPSADLDQEYHSSNSRSLVYPYSTESTILGGDAEAVPEEHQHSVPTQGPNAPSAFGATPLNCCVVAVANQ
jgi:hypothetical protein